MAMAMSPRLRKLALTAHVVSSVGWLGGVAGFLVLAIAGRASADPGLVRGAYLGMDLIGRYLLVPLSLVSLTTGVIQSVGTHWGLLRYYWVVVKLTLTVGAVTVLLLHQFTVVSGAAQEASTTALDIRPNVGRWATQLVADAFLAVVVLLTTTTLSVFKPWGRTRYGRRKHDMEIQARCATPRNGTVGL
jgi:hypothetical protein